MVNENKNLAIEKRDSFVFYRSFMQSIDALPERLQLRLYKIITSYGLDMKEPSFDDSLEGYALKAVFLGIKVQIDRNYERFKNGTKGKEYGNMGGAPKGNQNARKHPISNQPQINPKTTPNENGNENINIYENINEDEDVDVYANVGFRPPTLQDISSYISSISSTINPEKFFDYHCATGWKDKNGNKIEDWKAVVRLWQKHEKPTEKPKKVKTAAEILKEMGL